MTDLQILIWSILVAVAWAVGFWMGKISHDA